MKKAGSSQLEYLWVTLLVFCATGLFVVMRSYFAVGQWALLYLMIVVIVGSLYGFKSALLASVLAFFFLELLLNTSVSYFRGRGSQRPAFFICFFRSRDHCWFSDRKT